VGGIDLGFGWAGIKTAWFVEKDPFARQVLGRRFPGVPKFTDVRKCGETRPNRLEPVDIISGGFPCQDESISGRRRGLGTPENPTKRSGLWFQYLRIVRELRPRWVLIENVSRLLHTADGDRVLADMEGAGYSCSPLVLDAEILGAPHKRERTWILCHDNDAHDGRDFKELMTEQWALPPECQEKIEEARERWNYWKHELSGGTGHGFSPMTVTPTATAISVKHWSEDNFIRKSSGRLRKRTKRGTEGSMSWFQEMAARAAAQENPKLMPTPEACEEFMGFPKGWTDLGSERPEAVAYAKILRGVEGIPDCKKRLKAIGNAVVPLIPMLFGCFIQEYESRLSSPAHTGSQWSKEDSYSMENEKSQSITSKKKMSPQQLQYYKVIKMPSPELGAAVMTATARIARHVGNALAHDAEAKKERDEAQREFQENIAYYYEAKQRLLNPGYRTDVDGGKERTPAENEKNFGAPNWAAFAEKCVAYSLQHADRMLRAFAKLNGLLTDEGENIDDPELEDGEGTGRSQPRRTEDPTAQRRYEFIATKAMDIASQNPEGEAEKKILAAAEHEPAPLMPLPPDLFTQVLAFLTNISSTAADESVRAEAKQLASKMRLHKPAPEAAAVPPVVAEEEKRKRDKRLARKNGQPLGASGTPEHVQRLEPTRSGMRGDSGGGAIPAQDLQTDHQAGLEAPISSPIAEPPIAGVAGVKQPNAAETDGGEPVFPGDWVTTDSTTKYLGRFQGKKGKRFILAWYDKPLKKWCPNPKITDGIYRRLTEEEVRERFPGALEAWGAPQAAATPAPKRWRRAKASNQISLPKVTVCSPGLSPEEEERKSGTLDAASGHPASRLGGFVRNEEGKWEFDPEEQQVPPAKLKATDPKPFRVKKRIQGDIIDFAVIRDGDNLPEEVFNAESEATTVCESLNTSPVASIVPQHINPQSAALSAA
jgi:site-specific DNA-cytosine methylase